MIGQLLQNRYQVIRELGKGAFGQTYLAQDTQYPGKPYCVVKHLQPDDPRSLEKAKQLFLREAEILAKLGKHDQIPELKAYSEQEFYLVQEFIDGHPLRDEISVSESRWTENQVISLLSNILPVLVFIHDEGVIHRDIKPDNIMRRQRDNKLVLIDFGAIKEVLNNPETGGLSVVGSRVYTSGYAPSEQLIGKPRLNSDIYALGMTAIEALTGKYPHLLPQDDNTDEVIWQDKASVSPGLTAILNKMVRFSHRERYQSAGEVLLAVQQLIQALQQAQAARTNGVNQLILEWQEAGQLRNTTIQDKQQSKNPGTIRIGRDPAQCDIVFSDLTVSGLHVEIFFNQQQQCFYVRNLRQTNPPIIDGRPLPTGEVRLSQSSSIQLGQMNLRVTHISLGQTSSVAPTQLATTTQPTQVATSYQPQVSTPIASTQNPPASASNNTNEHINRAQQLIEQKSYRQAIGVLDSALSSSPNDGEAYYWRGYARLKAALGLATYSSSDSAVKQCAEAAIEDFNQALQINPNLTEAFKQRKEASKLCETLEPKPHKQREHINHAQQLIEQKSYRQAIDVLNSALSSSPNDAEAYYWRGYARLKAASGLATYSSSDPAVKQAAQAAIEDFDRALKINGNFTQAQKQRKIALELSKNSQPQPQKQPQNQKWECKHIIKAHSDSIFSLAFSPDGQTLASCSGYWDKTIKLWNVHTGKEIRTLYGHTDGVRSVAFSPDGQILASGGSAKDKTIKLWDIKTGLELHTLKGHSDVIYSIAFSPDGEILASGSQDKNIKLWNVSTGKEFATMKGHSDWVRSVAISPSGEILASGSSDDTIKLWRIKTRQEFKNFKANTLGVSSVRFSPDGQLIASSGGDATIKLWNVTTGKEIRILKGHVLEVSSIAFSPNGQTIVSASAGGSIKLWDVETGNDLLTLKGHKGAVHSVRFSPDREMIASCSDDETIRIWYRT